MRKIKRVYKEARVGVAVSGKWPVVLDGKSAKTPAGAVLVLPTQGLAAAVAAEWEAQMPDFRPDAMPLTRLANTAIDRIAPNRSAAVAELIRYAASDVVSFRAAAPEALAERQSAAWDPLLEWTAERYGVELKTSFALTPIVQPADELRVLESFVVRLEEYSLSGLLAAAALLGSAILALALFEGRLGAEQAFAAAEVDAVYQAEIWGLDPIVSSRNINKMAELSEIARFLQLTQEV